MLAVVRHPPTHARTTAFRFCWLFRRRSAAHRPGECSRGRVPRTPAVRVPETSRSLRNGTATGSSPRRWKTPHGRDTCVSLHPASSPRVRRRHEPPVSTSTRVAERQPSVSLARSSRPPCRPRGEGRKKERASSAIASLSRRCRPFSSTTLVAVAVRVPRVPVPPSPFTIFTISIRDPRQSRCVRSCRKFSFPS